MLTRSVWQISGGPATRTYANVLLSCGVVLIGPGDSGQWGISRDDNDFGGISVRLFASEMANGDVILLRVATAIIVAVGLVASVYMHVDAFDDVNGLDLQHGRRVRWFTLPIPHEFSGYVFGASPPRCSRVWNKEALDFAERFVTSEPTHWQTAELPDLPQEDAPLDHLPAALERIVARVADLAPLFQDRETFGEPPAEEDPITHFVVPFLSSLGWPLNVLRSSGAGSTLLYLGCSRGHQKTAGS